MGILIMQDVLLGVLMALLPNMADSGIERETNYDFYIMIGFRLICGEITCCYTIIVIISRMKSKTRCIILDITKCIILGAYVFVTACRMDLLNFH